MAKDNQFVKDIADIETDFPQWYTDVVLKTKLVDYGPVKGTMVIRPYGYAIWENIQRELDKRFRATGHQNAYFPMLIPESYLKKEAEHVEGFAPEVAVVTHAGGEKLAEPLVIRPTSETIIGEMYSKWLQSYRDLPILINQWANVVRWEKTTRPFLRGREFLWQEGHTLHATEAEARKETLQMLEIYAETCEQELAMPVIRGNKTDKEKFAGAENTYTIECMMHDHKALQSGTSHYFGDGFARAFDITYTDKNNQQAYPHQTSWGMSTRVIGGLIMTHGDNNGLVLPPHIAPIQVIVLPIAAHKPGVTEKAEELIARLKAAGLRAQGDFSDNSPGWKFANWEMKGVPLRVEIGPKDIEAGHCVAVRRDNGEKITVALDELEARIPELLETVQQGLFDKAKRNLDEHTYAAHSLAEAKELQEKNGGFIKTMWCGDLACELEMKDKAGMSSRCIPFEQEHLDDVCPVCGKPAKCMIYWGVAY